jgi:hypothetical protein
MSGGNFKEKAGSETQLLGTFTMRPEEKHERAMRYFKRAQSGGR